MEMYDPPRFVSSKDPSQAARIQEQVDREFVQAATSFMQEYGWLLARSQPPSYSVRDGMLSYTLEGNTVSVPVSHLRESVATRILLQMSEADVDALLAQSTTPVTRQKRWIQLAEEGNLSKQEIEYIRNHGGDGMKKTFGKELAHPPKRAASQGFDYSDAIPKTAADHRGIQHRYLKERSTGTTITLDPKPRTGGTLDLPPEGSLP
jgi:hypothetical protein